MAGGLGVDLQYKLSNGISTMIMDHESPQPTIRNYQLTLGTEIMDN